VTASYAIGGGAGSVVTTAGNSGLVMNKHAISFERRIRSFAIEVRPTYCARATLADRLEGAKK